MDHGGLDIWHEIIGSLDKLWKTKCQTSVEDQTIQGGSYVW